MNIPPIPVSFILMFYSIPSSKNTINYSSLTKNIFFSHSYEEVYSDVLLRVYQITRRHITESSLYRFMYVATFYRALFLVLSNTLAAKHESVDYLFQGQFPTTFFPVCRKF